MSPSPDPLAARVIEALRDAGLTLATSESLTGGLIGATLTSVPGASAAYVGGAVVYATELKARLSGVPDDVLAQYGAVSQATVKAMAAGIRAATGADWGIAVSGVAGPDEQEGHPAGTVWVGLAGPAGEPEGRLFHFGGGRPEVRAATVETALATLLAALTAG